MLASARDFKYLRQPPLEPLDNLDPQYPDNASPHPPSWTGRKRENLSPSRTSVHLRTPPELHREVRTDTSKFSFRVEKTSQPSQERNHVLVRTAGELDRWLSNRKVVGADVRAYIPPSIHLSHHIQTSITSSSRCINQGGRLQVNALIFTNKSKSTNDIGLTPTARPGEWALDCRNIWPPEYETANESNAANEFWGLIAFCGAAGSSGSTRRIDEASRIMSLENETTRNGSRLSPAEALSSLCAKGSGDGLGFIGEWREDPAPRKSRSRWLQDGYDAI
ncbi:uncharacterized protein CLUP02_02071 [Colletotrichum lupini]|uniref:Uncharacterized protein n=1 Tax=Colletotrichum lupini TaxID=145971 RepID=A0A9Q8SDL0_9PEZI|nr:uncharacterized protein CLUP02_02071 [Colletotrichum lupini]UQC75417.1 hypothetical protein CLUP02_02071 [Colletotrichum lupini]